jgi:hypothetical protein
LESHFCHYVACALSNFSILLNRIALRPPLIISEDKINDLFDRLTPTPDATADWAKREKLF